MPIHVSLSDLVLRRELEGRLLVVLGRVPVHEDASAASARGGRLEAPAARGLRQRADQGPGQQHLNGTGMNPQ